LELTVYKLVRAVGTALAIAVVVGCRFGEDPKVIAERGQQARSIVVGYYEAVSGGRADRGWDLIHPDMRRFIFGNERDRYVALAEQADWSSFRVEVGQPVPDDEQGTLYFVPIRVPGGRSAVPPFLLAHRDYSLVPIFATPGFDPTQGTIAVRFDPSGVAGMWAGGG
jgi:hypothetical protein